MFYIGLYRENEKKSYCLKPQGLELDIWYVASPSGPLPSLFKLYPWGQKWPCPGCQMFYIGLYRENTETSFLKPEGLAIEIWYLASPSGPLPSLFKLYPWG